jgi:hypothetical protein
MSSIRAHVRAATKEQAKNKLSIQLAAAVKANPAHHREALSIAAVAHKLIDIQQDNSKLDVVVSVNCVLEGRLNEQASDYITKASLGVQVELLPKEDGHALEY